MKTSLITISIVALCLILFFIFFTSTDPVTNYPSENKGIVAFGDSLIAGVGATAGNDLVSRLEQEIGQPIENFGVSGDTTRDGLARIDKVLEKEPKVVILLLGGNDYLRKIPSEETFANLETMINQFHEVGSIVLLLGVRGGVLRDNFAAEYEALADKHNTAHVSDVLDGLIGRPNLMDDAIHPNDAGYALMADRIAPTLLLLAAE